MNKIKPSKGPSVLNGVTGIAFVVMGIVFTIISADSGAFYVVFGILCTILAVAFTFYNFKNAAGNRKYSEIDIVNSSDDDNPLNLNFNPLGGEINKTHGGKNFCPHCGSAVEGSFSYCPRCGKMLK